MKQISVKAAYEDGYSIASELWLAPPIWEQVPCYFEGKRVTEIVHGRFDGYYLRFADGGGLQKVSRYERLEYELVK